MLSATTPEIVPKLVLWIVRAFMLEVSASWRVIDQLFVCSREHIKGTLLSKDELVQWVKEVIMQAYLNAGQEVPLSIKRHFTYIMATSWHH